MILADELLAHARGKALIAIRVTTRTGSAKSCVIGNASRHRIEAGTSAEAAHPSGALRKARQLGEVFFHNLKRFRAIAARFEKTACNFLALIQLACAWLWLDQKSGYPPRPVGRR